MVHVASLSLSFAECWKLKLRWRKCLRVLLNIIRYVYCFIMTLYDIRYYTHICTSPIGFQNRISTSPKEGSVGWYLWKFEGGTSRKVRWQHCCIEYNIIYIIHSTILTFCCTVQLQPTLMFYASPTHVRGSTFPSMWNQEPPIFGWLHLYPFPCRWSQGQFPSKPWSWNWICCQRQVQD